MKQKVVRVSKGLLLGITAIIMGALGVAGGNRTMSLLKAWFTSLFHKEQT